MLMKDMIVEHNFDPGLFVVVSIDPETDLVIVKNLEDHDMIEAPLNQYYLSELIVL